MNRRASEDIRKKAEANVEFSATERLQRWTDRTVDWIRTTVTEAGCSGTVLGLSGGLDSAVVAALCARAFPESCHALCLPCHSLAEDIEDAKHVADVMGFHCEIVDLSSAFDAMVEVLPSADLDTQSMAQANLKPRLRMAALYYVASQRNSLVIGTGNRAEIYLGYFTKFGDGGSDLLPLARLTKGQVFRVAEFLGVPQRIIDRPPSAGLWPGQTDEDEMGITYNQIDSFLLRGVAQPEVGARIRSMHDKSAHKRAKPPIPPFTLGEGVVPVSVEDSDEGEDDWT